MKFLNFTLINIVESLTVGENGFFSIVETSKLVAENIDCVIYSSKPFSYCELYCKCFYLTCAAEITVGWLFSKTHITSDVLLYGGEN